MDLPALVGPIHAALPVALALLALEAPDSTPCSLPGRRFVLTVGKQVRFLHLQFPDSPPTTS
jgi:hypothetical protein